MIITGFPRAGTTLLLLLLAGSVTNRIVYARNETCDKRRTSGISKDPFASIRHDDLVEPISMIRHPMAVLTSKHAHFSGEYGFYWDKRDRSTLRHKHTKTAPYALEQHYAHLIGPRYRYEHLCADPDGFQEQLGEEFNLEYSRKFSDWPYGDVTGYWRKMLGKPRPITQARKWNGKDRIEAMCDSLKACIRGLGYAD